MQPTETSRAPKDRLAIALDFPGEREAMNLVDRLQNGLNTQYGFNPAGQRVSMWQGNSIAGKGSKTARRILRADTFFLIVALSISFLPMIGCLESTFNLANESRLPKWVTLPRGVTRADVSLKLSYYTSLGGDDAKVTLKDRGGRTIAEVWGKMKCHSSFASYPAYEVVVVNGITEVIEHKKMEPIFYIADDPTLKRMLFARDRACE